MHYKLFQYVLRSLCALQRNQAERADVPFDQIEQEYAGMDSQTYTVAPEGRPAFIEDKGWSLARMAIQKAGLPLRASATQLLLDVNNDGSAPDMTKRAAFDFVDQQTNHDYVLEDVIGEALRDSDPNYNPDAQSIDQDSLEQEIDRFRSTPPSEAAIQAANSNGIAALERLAESLVAGDGDADTDADAEADSPSTATSTSSTATATATSSSSSSSLPLSSSGSESDSDSPSSSSDSDEASRNFPAEAAVQEEDAEQLEIYDVRGALIHAGMKKEHANELYRDFRHRFGIDLEDAFDRSTIDNGLDRFSKLPHAEKLRKIQAMYKRSPYEEPLRPQPINDFDVEIARRTFHEPMGSLPTTLEERRVVMRVQLAKLTLPPIVQYVEPRKRAREREGE